MEAGCFQIPPCRRPCANQTLEYFGNSKNRTTEQAKSALVAAERYLTDTGQCIIAFTDGSALTNPGLCGAGAAIYWNGLEGQPTLHKRPISKLSTSYHGELQAIDLALTTIVNKSPPLRANTVHVITDCQAALQAVLKCNITKNFGYLLKSIQDSVTDLKSRNITVKIFWTAGHVNLKGNELADTLAKEAAWLVENVDNAESIKSYISISEIKNHLRKSLVKRWQKRWSTGKDARHTHNLIPLVKVGGYKSVCERPTETKLLRLILGMTALNEHMHRIMPQFYTSPNCACDSERGTIEHYLLRCPLHTEARKDLLHEFESVCLNNSARRNWDLKLETILSCHSDLSNDSNSRLRQAVVRYIRTTAISI